MIKPAQQAARRCLLIAPLSFYSFHLTVAQGLARKGYVVDVLNEEFPANSFGKILGKLAIRLLRRFTLRGLRARLDGRDGYDLVLIIKGRGLGPQALEYLRTKARRIVAYNFDSFRFNPSPLDWYHLTHRFATFDILDARAYCTPLVHLFSAAETSPLIHRKYDFSIIQRVHSNRLVFAELLLKALPASACRFVFLYESSLLTCGLSLMRHPLMYARLWRYIAFKPLSYTQAMESLRQSRVTFDYAHPKQSGVTVRCFEAQSLGVAILTNNREAVDCGLFSSDAIAHLPAHADIATVAALLVRLMQCTPEPRRRSIDEFLEDLLVDGIVEKPLIINVRGDVT